MSQQRTSKEKKLFLVRLFLFLMTASSALVAIKAHLRVLRFWDLADVDLSTQIRRSTRVVEEQQYAKLLSKEEELLEKLLRCNPDNNTLILTEGRPVQVCVNGTFPPFVHKLPQFVPETDDERIFMMQPENREALDPDWIDWSWKTCFDLQDGARQLTSVVVGMDSWSFQHFHDNALPWVYQARKGYDLIQNLTTSCRFQEHIHMEHPRSGVVMEEWIRLGFQESAHRYRTQPQQPDEITVTFPTYPRDKGQVRVHPIHVEWLRSVLPPSPSEFNRTKVVWVSRKGPRSRQLNNEDAMVEYLKSRGADVVTFNPSGRAYGVSKYGVRELVSLLGDACALVGIHGGAMYNQFFAHTETTVIELMPVDRRTKLLPGQPSTNLLPNIAHRAMWHNANVLKQPFWRIHFPMENDTTFDMELVIMDRIATALAFAGCMGNNTVSKSTV